MDGLHVFFVIANIIPLNHDQSASVLKEKLDPFH